MVRLQHGKDFSITTSRGGFTMLTGRHDDGTPWVTHLDVVIIKLNDGREFYLPNGHVVWVEDEYGASQTIKGEYVPGAMADKVTERGVDLQHWVELEKQAPLEDRLADEWMREQEERVMGGGW